MARRYVDSINDFLADFPKNGHATASFSAFVDKPSLIFQVRLPDTRVLTYMPDVSGLPHTEIKRLAESLIERLDQAKVPHDALQDDSPMEMECHHEFFNGVEGWMRLGANPPKSEVKWSDREKVRKLVGSDQDKFREEYKQWRKECLERFVSQTGQKIMVLG